MEVPSLRRLCVRLLAQYVHCMYELGDMQNDIWAEILAGSGPQTATPLVVRRIEEINPHLECAETDERYWKAAVDRDFPYRGLAFPYPCLRSQVRDAHEPWKALVDLCGEASSSTASTSAATPAARSLQPRLRSTLQSLAAVRMSTRLLEDTGIGHTFKRARKLHADLLPKDLQHQASTMFDHWRDHHRLLRDKASRKPGKGMELSAAELEEAHTQCNTWKQLYTFLASLRDKRLAKFSNKAKSMYQKQHAQRHGTKGLRLSMAAASSARRVARKGLPHSNVHGLGNTGNPAKKPRRGGAL
mmetsp:Transcript_22515/g.65456  ORF Transcript_22515/g.65456 Transcript_22515/m.65456 type:complete len:301 (-) Transcript_22515:239-1141(-)